MSLSACLYVAISADIVTSDIPVQSVRANFMSRFALTDLAAAASKSAWYAVSC